MRNQTNLVVVVTVLAGTSGWQYRDWRAAFYPAGVPQRRWLEHYAQQFATVENNGTFYRLPARDTFPNGRGPGPGDLVRPVKGPPRPAHLRAPRPPPDA